MSRSESDKSILRGSWTKQEDATLIDMVNKFGAERWVVIAKGLGSRTGKQCRERWHNHLDPKINKSPFTPEEDTKIWNLFNSLGPRWALMAKEMPGRPDNSIKNHFNTFLRPRRLLKRNHSDEQTSAKKQPAKRKKAIQEPRPIQSHEPSRASTSTESPTPYAQCPITTHSLFDHFDPELIQMPHIFPAYSPFSLTSFNTSSPLMNSIPSTLTEEDPDLDFLIRLGNELGIAIEHTL
ncbi:hypothetical protein DSO57_1015001 [Entomophthora muscae]|uniref:Uncharacterized protein n=1 Tax=Entomophthora muscae TaxID=34485 RepID=A0ACC2RJY0_9FUNG|nr:hypothetical protein DSO57_1015001 [Entomophthora muscae]